MSVPPVEMASVRVVATVIHQAITITLPEEGTVYSFRRTVQVAENAPLELTLRFARVHRLDFWRVFLVLALLVVFAGGIASSVKRREA